MHSTEPQPRHAELEKYVMLNPQMRHPELVSGSKKQSDKTQSKTQPRHAELVSASKKQSNSQDSEQNKIYANKLA